MRRTVRFFFPLITIFIVTGLLIGLTEAINDRSASIPYRLSDPVLGYAIRAAIVFSILGMAILLFGIIGIRDPLLRLRSKIWMGVGIIGLPIITLSIGSLVGLEEAKTVDFCFSCHKTMGPYIQDMENPDSDSLSAKHFQNRWINRNQCYGCHTDYGLLGDFRAKVKGFTSNIRYYFETWEKPIKMRQPFKNANCLKCHGMARKIAESEVHADFMDDLISEQESCSSCHTPVHKVKR